MADKRFTVIHVTTVLALICWAYQANAAPAPKVDLVATDKEAVEEAESGRVKREAVAKTVSLEELTKGANHQAGAERKKRSSSEKRNSPVSSKRVQRSKRQVYYPYPENSGGYEIPDYNTYYPPDISSGYEEENNNALSEEDLYNLYLLLIDELRNEQEEAALPSNPYLYDRYERAPGEEVIEREPILIDEPEDEPPYEFLGRDRRAEDLGYDPRDDELSNYPVLRYEPEEYYEPVFVPEIDDNILARLELKTRIAELAEALNEQLEK